MVRTEITRRELAAALAAPMVAAQSPQVETLTEARSEARRDIERLQSFPLPMGAEPAFVFKP